jgi:hypothetical protein
MNRFFFPGLVLISCFLALTPAVAQEITGAPGSPSGTTTIDGNQLPPQPAKFGGVIKESEGLDALMAAQGGAAERPSRVGALPTFEEGAA